MTFVLPVVMGVIMGEKAGKNDIFTCCWVLSGVAGVGVVAAGFLLVNDRGVGTETSGNNGKNLAVELLAEKISNADNSACQEEAQDVEAAGGREKVPRK
jgi:hypothetical protein